jgi:hypothetical protein
MTSENPDVKGTDTPGQQGVPGQPSDAELAAMSREELVELGGRMDGVETVYKEPRWPVEGTKAEKRANGKRIGFKQGFSWAGYAVVFRSGWSSSRNARG